MGNLKSYRERPHHSYSSLNCFLNICSLQYMFKYIVKQKAEHTSVNLIFGSAFHRAAEKLAVDRKQERKSKLSDLTEIFCETFTEYYDRAEKVHLKEGQTVNSIIEKGYECVKCLNDSWPAEKVTMIAEAFCVSIERNDGSVLEKLLIGEWDCVVYKNDKSVIVDWKTAARKWGAGKVLKDLQSTVFTYAYDRLYAHNPQMRFDVVTKTKTPTYTQYTTVRNKNHFDRLIYLIGLVENAVKKGVFIPNEQSFYCADCQFKSACKKLHNKNSRVISNAA